MGCATFVLLLLAAVSAGSVDVFRIHNARVADEVVRYVDGGLAAAGAPTLRALLLYQPPFDGSIVTQAYLSVQFELRARGLPTDAALARAYGDAAADTLAHMAAFGVPYARLPLPWAAMNYTARVASFAALVPASVVTQETAGGAALRALRLARRLSLTISTDWS